MSCSRPTWCPFSKRLTAAKFGSIVFPPNYCVYFTRIFFLCDREFEENGVIMKSRRRIFCEWIIEVSKWWLNNCCEEKYTKIIRWKPAFLRMKEIIFCLNTSIGYTFFSPVKKYSLLFTFRLAVLFLEWSAWYV